MCSSKDERKEKINSHIEVLKKGLGTIEESKEKIKKDIEEEKVALENLEKTEYGLGIELDFLKSLNADRVEEVDETVWDTYETQYYRSQNLCASIYDFNERLEERDSMLFTTLSGNYYTGVNSNWAAVHGIFVDTPVETEDFRSTAAKYEIDKHPVKQNELVYFKLSQIDNDKAELFQKIVREFGASSSDIKYARLMDLRSLIFDQLFEEHCLEADYSQTAWFQGAAAGSIEKKKRFCQPKYFILGNTDFAALDPLLQARVDDVCRDMHGLFGRLSDYGKHGADDRQTKIFFNETIGTFSEILQLRESLYT